MPIFEPVFAALDAAGVRYVVGGVATVLHGHPRLTADLDISLDLESDQVPVAIEALTAMGLEPLLPVPAPDFADPEIRRQWDPIPFSELWDRSEQVDVGGIHVRIAGIDDLISMKRMAGRPQDLADVEALELIRRAITGSGREPPGTDPGLGVRHAGPAAGMA